jgi:hypothetical protein
MLDKMIEAQNAQSGARSDCHPANQVADHNGGYARVVVDLLGEFIRDQPPPRAAHSRP